MKTILRFLTPLVCSFAYYTSGATNYTFTGSGDWTVTSNWAGGIMPPAPLSAGNTVIIIGNAIVNTTCINCSANTLLTNSGTIIVAAGGTLTLSDLSELTHIGSIIVNGTMVNKTVFEIFEGSAITVNGTFINQKEINNQGTISINNGGRMENQLSASIISAVTPSVEGTVVVNAGGTVINKNSAVLRPGKLINNGTIENSSVLSGNTAVTGSLVNAGILSPGNSAGLFTISGNYTASSTAMHNFEVGGMTATDHDKLQVNGAVKLDGILNVSLINGFIPNADHDLTIITGNITGTFSSVYKPSKYILVYNSNSVALRFNVTLPMLYIKLDVKKEGGTAKLSWEIHNEASVARYEIERSIDGRNFEKIGSLNAVMAGKYTFTDNGPKDKNFYRIKVIDLVGTHRYSTVVSLQQGQTAIALNVFPSPAQKDVTVQHASATPNSRLLLTSPDGRILKTVTPQPGAQQTLIDLSTAHAGLYVMQFQNGNAKTEVMMFSKQ